MAKRGKVKAVNADTVPSGNDEQPALVNSAAEAEDTADAPARKRPRAAKQQHQKQQSSKQKTEQDSAAEAKPAATSRSKKKEKQQQEDDAEQQQETNTSQQKASKGRKAAAKAAPAAEKPPYYLVKSEPSEFSIDDLEAKPNQTEAWEGVRNAQARNIMKGMAVGDMAFFYHSSCKVPGIVGIAKVVREAYPDPTAFDPTSKYLDPSSSKDKPKWWMVDWQLVRRLKRQITLEELKGHKEGALEGMALFNRPRLSVQPVTKEQWEFIMSLEERQRDDE